MLRYLVAFTAAALLGCGASDTIDGLDRSSLLAQQPNIRIGVVPTASAVSLGSSGSFTVRSKATQAVLFSGVNGTVTVTLGSGSTSTSNWRVQVVCGNATNVATRKAAAEAAGYPTLTEFVPTANCTRLYIGSLPSTATLAERNALKAELVAKGLAATDALVRLITITTGITVYKVQLGATIKDSESPVVLAANTQVTINGALYRGAAEVIRNSAGSLAGVNELPLEQYLYGVVPRELGPIAWPFLEAQKAQAVAARAYAIRGLGKRAADGYDLLATTADQVYGGFSAEHPLSTQAVDETRGVVPTVDGKVIDALYFSTSGGYTANNEDVFSSSPVAYLRGVWDHEHGDSEHVLDLMHREINPQSLSGMKGGDFEADQSKFHRWFMVWTAEQMSAVVTDYAKSLPGGFAGASVGKVLAVEIVERSNSGRARRIEYVTESGTFADTRDHIRSSLRWFDSNGVKTNLFSTLFLIDPEVDPRTKDVVGFTAFGGGFGHGVGMCQTGAAGMAKGGYAYDAILAHYYRDIALTLWY